MKTPKAKAKKPAAQHIVLKPYRESPKASGILRIEEKIGIVWKGVKGCCSGNRPQKEVTARFKEWVGQKMLQHASLRYLGSGHGGGSARCSQSGGMGQARRCRGSISVTAYVEFLKE